MYGFAYSCLCYKTDVLILKCGSENHNVDTHYVCVKIML